MNLGRYAVPLGEYRRFGDSCYCIFSVKRYKNVFCLDLLTLRRCATSQTVPGSIPGDVTGFSVTYFFRPHHGPGVDSVPSENEYQEHFLGVKAADA